LGNGGSGVNIIDNATKNAVGDVDLGSGNIIAFNDHNGVTVTGAGTTGNLISRNSIFLNDLLGIDLGDNGVTPNDAKDPDTGPNNLQNKPVLNFATSASATTTISGALN